MIRLFEPVSTMEPPEIIVDGWVWVETGWISPNGNFVIGWNQVSECGRLSFQMFAFRRIELAEVLP